MPRKPKKPCRYPYCSRLTDERYCEKHKIKENKNYEKYVRDPRTKKRYGSTWRAIRKMYVHAHPLCEECLKNGRTTQVEEVHHILPLSRGGTHDFNNLMSLCKSCHSKITVLDGDRWRKKCGGGG